MIWLFGIMFVFVVVSGIAYLMYRNPIDDILF